MSFKIKQECVYCQAQPADSRDHVPPKSMFSRPKPNNLITVPSCVACNQGHKKDEDYFLAMITFTEAGVTTEGKKLWRQKLSRMYTKDRGIRALIAKSFSTTEVVTPGGLHLGRGLSIEPDWSRVKNVFTKIVRGLYYYEYSEPLQTMAQIDFVMLTDEAMATGINTNVVTGKRGWRGVLSINGAACQTILQVPSGRS